MSTEMLNRFDRIVAILIQLQSSRNVKAQDLAERFGVSLRTIYRDIRSLETSGVPVIGEPGVGYSIMEGYRLPPVMFTREEAGSFVAAQKLMQKFSDKKLGAYHESAMFKVKSVLRGNARDRVDALESQVWVNGSDDLVDGNPGTLDVLMDSIADKKQVLIQYLSFDSDVLTKRIIEPIGLFNENNYWYIMGFCHLRNDYRQFRTDRISDISLSENSFSRNHDGNLDKYKAQKEKGEKTRIVIRVDKKILRYISSSRKYYGFVSEKVVEDQVEMTFLTHESGNFLARWYLMFGDSAEIVEPESFRNTVIEILEKTRVNLEKNVLC